MFTATTGKTVVTLRPTGAATPGSWPRPSPVADAASGSLPRPLTVRRRLPRLPVRAGDAQPLEPMKKIARMLRSHEELLLNWFRAHGEISSGPVEGLNNKIRLVTRRSYGFRTCRGMELALYHNLGRLPEPPVTHRFC